MVYFIAIRAIIKDAQSKDLQINQQTMKWTFGVGALVILSYTIDNLAKCLVFFYSGTELNDTILFWALVATCFSSLGFFLAFFALIMVFKNYAVLSNEEKLRDKN